MRTSAPVPLNLRRWFAVASLGVITVMALSLGWLLSSMLTERMLRREGEVMMDFVQNLLTAEDTARYLAAPDDPQLRERFLLSTRHIHAMREPVRANAYGRDGTLLWSTDQALIGRRYSANKELDRALSGELVVQSGRIGEQGHHKEEHEGLGEYGMYFVESYIPIRDRTSQQVLGVMELYKVPTRLNGHIRALLIQLWLACALGAVGLFVTLYWLVARAHRTLRAQQAQLVEVQSLASAAELASAVAHNLRNPLASIRISAEMLEQSDAPEVDAAEHCRDIVGAVERADRWISELVRVAQAPQLQAEAVALGPLLAACLSEMGPEMARRRIDWSVQDSAAGTVLAHTAILRQIILSLMANAIEAMPQGGRLQVSWCDSPGLAGLRLSDSGEGIPEEVRQRLFRPFFSTKSGGLGIGLALVKRMVEQWQGTLTLSPAEPRGTCVEILLPRAPSPAATRACLMKGGPHGDLVGD